MRPIERRQPRVSVQDLRRDLREADEDRYRLLIRTGDWRHPRIGVQEIRRQLRDADEERFRLAMRVRTLLSVIRRAGISACLILAAGAVFAFWNTKNPDLPAISGVRTAALTQTAANASPSSELTALPPETAPAPPSPQVPTRQHRATAPSRNRAITARKPEPITARKPEAVRRIVPRPLHPGEFGRSL